MDRVVKALGGLSMVDDSPQRILVIKLSALGDFVLSIGSFQAIRQHHPKGHIVLLTTAPYESLARASGLFDDVWIDQRPAIWRPDRWLRLSRQLRGGQFQRVYDLQRSDRSAAYFRLFGKPKPDWVGTHRHASHRYEKPKDRVLHIADREAAQLALAGVAMPEMPDLGFLQANIERYKLPERYALLVPGGSAHRPAKRWPAQQYAKLATALAARDLAPYLLGAAAERKTLMEIEDRCPKARNLCGETGLEEIAALARGAALAVGSDTGPMHLIGAMGTPSIVLFSKASDPRKTAPRGPAVKSILCDDLSQLSLGDVLSELPSEILERKGEDRGTGSAAP